MPPSTGAASVMISLTTLSEDLRRKLEPRTSTAKRRLQAIETLANAGVRVGVMTAPIIPGLTDHEIPALVRAAVDAGASFAHYTLLRFTSQQRCALYRLADTALPRPQRKSPQSPSSHARRRVK